jgi:ABC-type nitrate/sulfonate/bicarbonate transport system ATPase subunit
MRIGETRRRNAGAHIALREISHRYRRNGALTLSDVSAEIKPCEVVALVGRSGCGKSTLLHILAGLVIPTAGSVRVDGALVTGPSSDRIVMFQQPHLYPWMSVAQNIGLGLKFAGRTRRERDIRVAELLRLVDLEGLGARNAQELSGGQQQRVALARSLATHPEVLLLDEPFSALDPVTRRSLQRDVRRIAAEIGITLIIVTHDIAEAVAMADRAFIMAPNPGRIAEILDIAADRAAAGLESEDVFAAGAQAELQAAFARACGRAVLAPAQASFAAN